MGTAMARVVTLHLGLAKTATKFLQGSFFPRIQGVTYLPSRLFYRQPRRLPADGPVLLSREFDNQLEREVDRLAQEFPGAGVILVLRRPDAWMASQYRRYVKNGGYKPFSEFLDLDGDRGVWRRDKVRFLPKLQHVERAFGRPPLVLFHEDLLSDPRRFLSEILDFVGGRCDLDRVPLGVVHRSWSERQLLFLRAVAPWFFPPEPRPDPRAPGRAWLRKRGQLLLSYTLMTVGLLVPRRFLGGPLVPPEELARVRAFYAEDWEACQRWAAERGAARTPARSGA